MKQQQKNEQMANQSEGQENIQKYMIDDFSVGINLMLQNDFQKAQKYFEQFLLQNKDHIIAMYLLCFALQQQNLIDEGEDILDRLMLIYPNFYNILIQYSNIKLEQDPNNIILIYINSFGYLEKNQIHNAPQILEHISKVKQNYYFPYCLQGTIQKYNRQIIRILKFDSASKGGLQLGTLTKSKLFDGIYLFGQLFLQIQAIYYLENANIQKHQSAIQMLYYLVPIKLFLIQIKVSLEIYLGQTLVKLQKFEEAILAFNKATSIGSRRKNTFTCICINQNQNQDEELVSSNKYGAAQNFFIQYQNQNPEDTSILYFQRDTLKTYKYYQEALEVNEKILQHNPECLQSILAQGELLQSLNRHDEAIPMFQLYISFDQENLVAIEKYAQSLEKLGENEQALDLFENYINKNDKDLQGYYCKGTNIKIIIIIIQQHNVQLLQNNLMKLFQQLIIVQAKILIIGNVGSQKVKFILKKLYKNKFLKPNRIHIYSQLFKVYKQPQKFRRNPRILICFQVLKSNILVKILEKSKQLTKCIDVLLKMLRLGIDDLQIHKRLSEFQKQLNDPRMRLIHLRLWFSEQNNTEYLEIQESQNQL